MQTLRVTVHSPFCPTFGTTRTACVLTKCNPVVPCARGRGISGIRGSLLDSWRDLGLLQSRHNIRVIRWKCTAWQIKAAERRRLHNTKTNISKLGQHSALDARRVGGFDGGAGADGRREAIARTGRSI